MQENRNISTYKQELKQRILKTAMSAFAEKGIKAVKMDDIAALLSISKRTLYEIFQNKEDLLFEGVKTFHKQKQKQMELIGLTSKNVMEIIMRVYKAKVQEFKMTNPVFYSDLSKYPTVLDFLNEENQKVHSKFVKFMKRGVKEGYFRKDIDYELTSRMFDALEQFIMREELYKVYSIEEIFKSIVFVSLRGLCTRKGVMMLETFE